jgi:hypothetical protein
MSSPSDFIARDTVGVVLSDQGCPTLRSVAGRVSRAVEGDCERVEGCCGGRLGALVFGTSRLRVGLRARFSAAYPVDEGNGDVLLSFPSAAATASALGLDACRAAWRRAMAASVNTDSPSSGL